MFSPPVDDQAILNSENVLRLVPNARIYSDENENRLKAYDENQSLWGFWFANNVNTGMSVDHRERILADRPAIADIRDAYNDYYTTAFEQKTYFKKKSVLKLSVQVLRDLKLPITCTPLSDRVRPHHCDVWPTAPNDNFIGQQYETLLKTYTVEINNNDS